MSQPAPQHHVLLDLPYGDPYPSERRGAQLVWTGPTRRGFSQIPEFMIRGGDEYEPAAFVDGHDLVRFCLASLAIVSVRDDDQLRDQIAQILKAVMKP